MSEQGTRQPVGSDRAERGETLPRSARYSRRTILTASAVVGATALTGGAGRGRPGLAQATPVASPVPPGSPTPVGTPAAVGSPAAVASMAPVDAWRQIAGLAALDPTALRDTAYPVPPDAVFVAPNGDDANPGTQDAPWATLAKAAEAAPAGGTVVLRGGTYRSDRVIIADPLTVQPYPGERVWIKGSLEVADWVRDGDVWRTDGWEYAFPPLSSLPGGGAGCPDDDLRCALDPEHPEADYRDMGFVDGQALRQVLRREDVAAASGESPATFYVDATAKQLFIGADPTGAMVEATTYANGLEVTETATGAVVRGLGFAHYGETATRLKAPGMTFEANTVIWNGVQGQVVNAEAESAVVRGNTFAYNGRKGMTAFGPPGLLVEGNLVSHNNVERFRLAWDGAGMKLVPVAGAVVRANLVQENAANAVWLDNSATDATVVYNLVRGNEGIGVFFEVSRGAIIASNVAVGNGMGVRVSGASDVVVSHNTLIDNGVNLNVYDSRRINGNAQEVAAGIDYETRNVTILANVLAGVDPGAAGSPPAALLDATHDPCEGQAAPCNDAEPMVATLDANLYVRSAPGRPSTLLRWRPTAAVDSVDYESLDDFRAATGFEERGVALEAGPGELFRDEAGGDYRLAVEDRPDEAIGPLAAVAAALNVAPDAALPFGALNPVVR